MSEPVTVLNGAVAHEGLSVRIEDLGPVGQITLRGDLAAPDLQGVVYEIAGVGVPAPLSAAFDGTRGALWMSPDELLILTAYDAAGPAIARIGEALAGTHHMAEDVSDARTLVRITGAGAQELMAKGAPLDVSDAAFPVGTMRRTHFAEIAVGIWRRDDMTWEMMCLQSFGQHLFDWLAASSLEGARVNYF
ncbi:MAG: sarcosine oxidase subunit gamma family protein [Pseudomonadota bacterium]